MSRMVYGKYYYGNKISDYGLEHNRVHYGTAWDYVLTDIECNAGDRAFDNDEQEA